MDELAGRTAVITGAGSGMGKAFALRFAAEGMAIVAADIQPDALAATVAELTATGHQVAGIATDVADPDSVQQLADAAYERFGAVHLLCNNAGVEGYLDGPIWAATPKDWEWTVGVNFWSVVHGIRAFVPRMLAGGEPGHVVNTCSMTSVVSAGNMYAITKHAVLALTEVLALDLARRDAPIGVTALCPGIIATNLFRGSRNRPARLREDDAFAGLSRDRDVRAGYETRDRMHATLAAGMPPAEVAAKLVDAVRVVLAQPGRPVATAAEQVRGNDSGAERGDADGRIPPREVQRQHLGQREHGVLGDRVHVAGADDRGHGAGVDDVAGLTAREHARHERPDAVHNAPEVHPDRPLPVLVGGRPDGAVQVALDAGVVAEQVDGAETLVGRIGESLHRVGVGDVGGNPHYLLPGRGQLGDRRRERVRLDVGGDNRHPLGGEPERERLAHAAARPGDDGCPPGE